MPCYITMLLTLHHKLWFGGKENMVYTQTNMGVNNFKQMFTKTAR